MALGYAIWSVEKTLMEHIRALLFDKDGTLVDFEATWGPAYAEALAALFPDDGALVTRILSDGGLKEDGRFAAGSVLAAGSYRDLAEAWTPYASGRSAAEILDLTAPIMEASAIANAKPLVDLAALFRVLRGKGYRIGIATNDTETSARRAMARLADPALLDFVVGCDSGHGGKPEPGMLLAFCDAVSIGPDATAVIGDNVHDLEMGRRGGAGALIGVLSGASDEDDFAGLADHVIADVGQLADLLVG